MEKCKNCGCEECEYENDIEPCYGQIEVVDEEMIYENGEIVDSRWIHACEKHKNQKEYG